MLDVAIIGAGPAGLTAAAALLRCTSNPPGIQVLVSRDHTYMPILLLLDRPA